MEIQYKRENSKIYIYFSGELDEYTAGKTRSQIDEVLNSSVGLKSVIFDFSQTSFMDSTGIGLLLGRYKKYLGKKRFFIKNVNSTIDRILTMSGVYKIIQKIN